MEKKIKNKKGDELTDKERRMLLAFLFLAGAMDIAEKMMKEVKNPSKKQDESDNMKKSNEELIAEDLKILSILLFSVVSINLTERIMKGDKKLLSKKQDEREVKNGNWTWADETKDKELFVSIKINMDLWRREKNGKWNR